MKYGQGFWCVKDGVRLVERVYPDTRGFEYRDGTGDCGEWLIAPWCFDYTIPGTDTTLRLTIIGNPAPVLHENAFDFDWASIPKLCRTLTCDKADYRVRAGSLPHDIGFCVHDIWPGFDMKFWNRMLFEIMEAYSVTREDVDAAVAKADGVLAKAKARIVWNARYLADLRLRNLVLAGVTVGGPFAWPKSDREIETYRRMLTVEVVNM